MDTLPRKLDDAARERVFLSITAGPNPRAVEAIVCTEDRFVIEATLCAIRRRLNADARIESVSAIGATSFRPSESATTSPRPLQINSVAP